MYTNIGIDAGTNSVKRALDRPDKTRNDFDFNGEMYQQVCGCAMGKRISPTFASIYTLSKSFISQIFG